MPRVTPLDTLRSILDAAYRGPSWHGPALKVTLRGVDVETASWRPGPGRNTIWELALHAAYWKYRICRRLTDEPPRSFELSGSNFFPRPEGASAAGWPGELEILEAWHERLVEAVGRFDPGRLDRPVGGDRFSYFDFISGAAAHDLYHAGQIRLIQRLAESRAEG